MHVVRETLVSHHVLTEGGGVGVQACFGGGVEMILGDGVTPEGVAEVVFTDEGTEVLATEGGKLILIDFYR